MQIPTQSMALLQDRLIAEATTAAWQEYFLFNAFVALLCLFPALPCWRRSKYQAPIIPEPGVTLTSSTATHNNTSTAQVPDHDKPGRLT